MKASEIRLELARLGWNTEDRLSDCGWGSEGKRGYSAWVSRWDWHGVRLGSKVSFHWSVRPDDLTPATVDEAWEILHSLAVTAWERFTASLPCQDTSGLVIEDSSITKIVCDVHGENPWIKLQKS